MEFQKEMQKCSNKQFFAQFSIQKFNKRSPSIIIQFLFRNWEQEQKVTDRATTQNSDFTLFSLYTLLE